MRLTLSLFEGLGRFLSNPPRTCTAQSLGPVPGALHAAAYDPPTHSPVRQMPSTADGLDRISDHGYWAVF